MVSEEKKDFISGTKFELLNENSHNLKFVSNPLLGIYRYSNGIYIEDKEAGWLKKFISDIRTNIDIPTLNEIVEEIRVDCYRDFEDFDKNTSLVPLLNCNYNLDTDRIEEFDPTIISTSRIPIKYDPKAKCHTIIKCFKEIIDPVDIPVLEELFGFLLSKKYEHKYMFLFHGGTDSGKSTILKLIKVFVDGKISAAPPHIIAIDRFAAAELFGKRANISGDISSKMLSDVNLIKMMLGDDDIHADKKFGNIFTYTNFAKLIFACNVIPSIPDKDIDNFISKVKIISVPHSIPKEKQDHSLIGRMTTPEELSGLFNLAIEGRKRLKKNNDFSNHLEKDQMMERYFSNTDPVVKFVREVVEISVTDVTPKDDVIKIFSDYCTLKNIKYPKASISFWKSFKSALPKDVIDYNRRIGSGSNQKYAVGGIRLRNLSEIETTENTVSIERPSEKSVEIVVEVPVINELKISTKTLEEENIDYGYDEPFHLSDPEPPLTAAEISMMNVAFAEIRKREEEDEKIAEEYEKTLPNQKQDPEE